MKEPSFLHHIVTDAELAADLAALKAGAFATWRLVGEAGYHATQRLDGTLSLARFKRLWLEDAEGREIVVTLQRLEDPAVWQPVISPDGQSPSVPPTKE